MTAVLCRRGDLEPTGAKGVTVGQRPAALDVVIVEVGGDVRAYVNRCPHLGMPLEILPDRFLDEDRRHLVCTTHGARFRVSDGVCVIGPCLGERLEALAITIDGDEVRLAGR